MHLDGGLPALPSDVQLAALVDRLHRASDVDPQVRWSIEVDPRTAEPTRLGLIAAHGDAPWRVDPVG